MNGRDTRILTRVIGIYLTPAFATTAAVKAAHDERSNAQTRWTLAGGGISPNSFRTRSLCKKALNPPQLEQQLQIFAAHSNSCPALVKPTLASPVAWS